MARKNGKSFDGTPIIATLSDIDSPLSKGYVTIQTRPESDPLALCDLPGDRRSNRWWDRA